MMKVVNSNEFKSEIEKDMVLVDFFATWCGPCKMLGPVLEELSENRDGVKIVKIDVDECSALAKKYGIMSVPTLLLFKNGEMVSKTTGYMDIDELNEFINM